LLEESGLLGGCARRAGEDVVDEKLERAFAVFVGWVFDLGDDFGQKVSAVDGLGVKILRFTFFDFGEVVGVEAHLQSVVKVKNSVKFRDGR